MNAGNRDPIETVVLLILENHSFDQMMGSFKSIYPTLAGVDPNSPEMNGDDNGKQFFQKETTERQVMLDPHHEVNHVIEQLSDHNAGRLKNYLRGYPKTPRQKLHNHIDYNRPGSLAALLLPAAQVP